MGCNKIQLISSLKDKRQDPCPTCILNICTEYPVIKSVRLKNGNFVWCNRIRDSDQMTLAKDRIFNTGGWLVICL